MAVTASSPITGSMAVYFDRGNPAVAATLSGSIAVYFDPAVPTVVANAGTTLTVKLDPGYTLGSVGLNAGTNNIGDVDLVSGTLTNIANTVGVYFDRANPAVNVGTPTVAAITATVGVFFDRANPSVNVGTPTVASITNTVGVYFDRANPSVSIGGASSSVGVYFDRGNPTVTANAGTGTLTVKFDPGYTLGNVLITNTPTVTANAGTGTFNVAFSASNPAVNIGSGPFVVNAQNTVGIGFASGQVTAQGGAGLNTIVAPEANRNIKVFAYSLTTTGIVSNNVRFTTGASAGATELHRIALQAPTTVMAGANMSVPPPAYLFATGIGNTLALYLAEASIVHYAVSYLKETA